MWVTEVNAVAVSDVQCIARNNPVSICAARQTPKKDPKFHQEEIFDGAGKSMNASLTILTRGCGFWMLVIIVLIVEYTTMIFHVIGYGVKPCKNNDDIYYVYFKCVLCDFLQSLHQFMGEGVV